MHYSGILVILKPGKLHQSIRELESIPGVEVRYQHSASGRIVVVQETETAAQQEEGLRRIQSLPQVHMAALVEHRIDYAQGEQLIEDSGGVEP